MSANPLSVIVPTRDRPVHLDSCLAALRAVLRNGDELLVVDSASKDAAAVAEVAARHGARVVRCDEAGVSLARNTGARAVHHELLAYVDDDVQVAAGWAAALAATLADPAAAFVTGRVSVPPAQEGYQRPVAVNDNEEPVALDARSTDALGSSANLGIRREALLQVGGFDESMGGGARFEAAEDLDLFDRLFAAGHTGRYEPAAAAFHDQWRDRRALLKLDWRYGLGAGARLAKLVRTDRRRARFVTREVLLGGDVRGLGRALRAREEFAVLTTLVRLAGVVAGFGYGFTRRVQRGLYV
jgi:glycosyltransferase involved in cell wall biosynthesis